MIKTPTPISYKRTHQKKWAQHLIKTIDLAGNLAKPNHREEYLQIHHFILHQYAMIYLEY